MTYNDEVISNEIVQEIGNIFEELREEVFEEFTFGEIEEVEKVEEDKEEVKEEVKEEEVVEMSKDMISSLVEEVEELKSQIIELEKTPGAEGFTHNPENETKSVKKVDLAKMSPRDRVAYYINNK